MRKFNALLFLVICVLSFVVPQFKGNSEPKISYELTSAQMASIEGAGCNPFQWALAVAGWVGCALFPEPFGCLIAFGATADCALQLVETNGSSGSGGGGTGGGPAAPRCPCPL